MQPRYDDKKEIYRDCRFCGGHGCLACKAEADKAYRREFPDGPQPVAVLKLPATAAELDAFANVVRKLLGSD